MVSKIQSIDKKVSIIYNDVIVVKNALISEM